MKVNTYIRGVKVLALILLISIINFKLIYGEIIADTNKISYEQGEEVIISGKVTEGSGIPVAIEVLDSQGNIYFIDQKFTRSGGGFEFRFGLTDEAKTGTYEVRLASENSSKLLEFIVEEKTCRENWKCGEWSVCSNGIQERICRDMNNCGTEKNKPETVRSCAVSGGGNVPQSNKGEAENNEKENKENISKNESVQEKKNESTVVENNTSENVSSSIEKEVRNEGRNENVTGFLLSRTATLPLLIIFAILSGILTYLKMGSLRSGRILYLLFLLIIINSVSSISVTRDLPEYVNVNDVFEVKINIDVDENNLPVGMILSERPPEGFKIVDYGKGVYDEKKGVIKWLFFNFGNYMPVKDSTISYKLKANVKESRYAFNGVLNADEKVYPVEGDIVLRVGKIKRKCMENWVCDEWQDCINGIQKRICRDLNNCRTEENKPVTVRSCNITIKKENSGESNNSVEENRSYNEYYGNGSVNLTENKSIFKERVPKNVKIMKNGEREIGGNLIYSPEFWNPLLMVSILIYLLVIVYEIKKRNGRNKKPWEDSLGRFY